MKQLLILSGKGGTGKTTIASAFIKLSKVKAYADCDVDAPNLHLVLKHNNFPKKTDYFGLPKSRINQEQCIKCNLCIEACRFQAIKETYQVDIFQCEGCGVCELVCPVGAISFYNSKSGELMLYKNYSVFSTAELKMGSGTSGKLVTEVKNQVLNECNDYNLVIIDGSPGIGCPVIASLNGVDLVLIVVEPSISGISDMKRIIKTANNFHSIIAICINKFDTNINKSKEIELYCNENNLSFVGKIPFDHQVIEIINNGKSIVDIECESSIAVKEVFKETIKLLNK